MTDKKTVDTYNTSAELLSHFFQGIGSRVADIEKALQLAGVENDAQVVEIGCGDGRDAEEIVSRVASYVGFDPSVGLLEIAHNRLPGAKFIESDALTFDYPKETDVVYAFASLLHLPQEEVREVFVRVHESLRAGGIFMVSLKERAQYEVELQNDKFGERTFYYYNEPLLSEIAGQNFIKAYEAHKKIGNTDWVEIAFRKVN